MDLEAKLRRRQGNDLDPWVLDSAQYAARRDSLAKKLHELFGGITRLPGSQLHSWDQLDEPAKAFWTFRAIDSLEALGIHPSDPGEGRGGGWS